MMHTVLMFLAPGPVERAAPRAATRPPQALRPRQAPRRRRPAVGTVLLESALVVANAAGLLAFVLGCWLLLPLLSLWVF